MGEKEQREARLAAALRENLKKRKAQARERDQADEQQAKPAGAGQEPQS